VLVIDPGNEDAIRGIEKAKKANTEHYLNSKEADLVEKRLKEIAKRKEQSLLPEKLETHKGHIYVNSEPPAAAIYINGNYKAKTPAEVSLATGEYTVVLIKDNYKTEAVRLNLKEGMNLPLSVRLSPK
ncbi:MAG: PEGA domain-containing protein, partial [Candidatus Subteraquimicrobiales bacterium]|nr:PEGA domain-containing protein [Candidatus Subteraquimicrobiales bacterium]